MYNTNSIPTDGALRIFIEDLQTRGLLYQNHTPLDDGSTFPQFAVVNYRNRASTGVDGFLAWSASPWTDQNNASETWDVRASVVLNARTTPQFVVNSYHCSLLNSSASWVLGNISSIIAMSDWVERAYVLLGGELESESRALEVILNAMVMSAGTGNVYQWGNATVEREQDLSTTVIEDSNRYYSAQSDYGCLTSGTAVRFEFWFILFIRVVTFLELSVLWAVMFTLNCLQPHKKLAEDIPDDFLSWQVATVRNEAHDGERKLETKDIEDWEYGWVSDGTQQWLGIRKRGIVGQSEVRGRSKPRFTRFNYISDFRLGALPKDTRPAVYH